MTYVFDTNVLVDFLRRDDAGTTAVRDALASGRRVAASVLVRIEIHRGSRPHQAAAIDSLDALLDWVPVDHEIAGGAARHADHFGASHSAIDAVDYVIAATSERLAADLITRNVRHFPMFPGLEPPY